MAIDRTCKLAYAELHTDKKKMTAVQFLRHVIKALPYKIHTLLTDNGAQFTHRKQDKPASMHLFDCVCHEHDIEHRLTKINHPWTNGQVERMNRTIKEATCIIPFSNGVLSYTRSQYRYLDRSELWDNYYTLAPARQRRCVETYKIVKRA